MVEYGHSFFYVLKVISLDLFVAFLGTLVVMICAYCHVGAVHF